MSPGKEFDHTKILLTQASQADYEDLCRLDVLGLQDKPEHYQYAVHDEFRERHPENDILRAGMKPAYSGGETTHHYHVTKREACDD